MLSKDFSSSIISILLFSLFIVSIWWLWFIFQMISLYSKNKSNFIMTYYYFYVLLNAICLYLFEVFIFIYTWDAGLWFSFLIMGHPVLTNSFYLSLNEVNSAFYFPHVLKSLHETEGLFFPQTFGKFNCNWKG